ncbi:GntR family transcriptional regulator [Bradyrhizobium sp. KB893862 SZCCT0404]|uniref:GntR family transcriptional regulator n=1 Tax=Bradyrhizobium sp. KB893862 SZCCT0404 TaxID=2807672 RepID=UPI001BA9C88A|nr:GntR family transcriptional regulator [Bradyrhizobium sp. KB893862 SZCCT0404]
MGKKVKKTVRKGSGPKGKTRATSRPKAAAAPAATPKTGSLVDRAYEEIKERIITVFFLPGQYLNEGAICALLGLGRTPVHQALHRLAADGLVEIMPRKGVIVLPDSIAEIIKILDSRMTVEPELARHAALNATPETAAELKALARFKKVDENVSEIDGFTVSDRAFHRKIGEISGNQVMAEFARNLHERSWRYWYLHLWQTLDIGASNRQHMAISDAVAAGDAEGAAQAMREHISSLKHRLSQIQDSRGSRTPRAPNP